MLDLEEFRNKKIHFIGICGHSMCGLAEILKNWGYRNITGSDRTDSDEIGRLNSLGIKASVGHDENNVKDAALVVYTAAIPKDNPERSYAETHGIPCIDRAALLGMISARCRRCIAVSGSHGKTTTTGMTAEIFRLLGMEPTIHVGGVLPSIGSGVYTGGREYFITEACEYVDSFLSLRPHTAVILNIDSDHLDYFKTEENIYRSFMKFASYVPDDGHVVGCYDDEKTRRLMSECGRPTVSYGMSPDADYHPENVAYGSDGCPSYDLYRGDGFVAHVELSVIGEANLLDSMAAMISAMLEGVPAADAARALKKFGGASQRFDYKGSFNGARIYTDYAHHPGEVQALIKAAGHIEKNRLWVVYEPLHYSRTKAQFDRFVDCFAGADKVIFIKIFGDREPFDPTISSGMVADAIVKKHGTDCRYIPEMKDCGEYLKKHLEPGDIVLIMCGGNREPLEKRILE